MNATFLREGFGFPASHPCRNHRNQIYGASLQRNIAPDGLKALAPEQLTSSRHVLFPGEAVIILNVSLSEGSSRNPQLGVLSQLCQQESEVVWIIERDVSIQTADKGVLKPLTLS